MNDRFDWRLALMVVLTAAILGATVLQILAPRLQQSLLSTPSYASGTPSIPVSGPAPLETPLTTPVAAHTSMAVGIVQMQQDTFERTSQEGWGNATNGTPWIGDAQRPFFSVHNGIGLIGGANGTLSALIGSQQENIDTLVFWSVTSFQRGQVTIQVVSRWHDDRNLYKATVNGSVLTISKRLNGLSTVLASVPFQAHGHTIYALRFRTEEHCFKQKYGKVAFRNRIHGWSARPTGRSREDVSEYVYGLRKILLSAFTSFSPNPFRNILCWLLGTSIRRKRRIL